MLAATTENDPEVDAAVGEIIAAVRRGGDSAVLEYTRRFDGLAADALSELRISATRLDAAWDAIDSGERAALTEAAARIRGYHEHQRQDSWHYLDEDGSTLGQRITPLDRVGVYVPGGKASYPSSVLMNTIPARVAGVAEIVMTVPAPSGELNPLVLAAARLAGVDEVWTIGGAQAIAALAFGAGPVRAVDKIVGPGNRYVAAAKRHVFGVVGIDMLAGPSEIVIVCDGGAPVDWMVMDLFSQAEHDEEARAILISPDCEFLDRVEAAIESMLPTLERAETVARSLAAHGALIEVRDLEEALSLVNRLAPEHLELSVENPQHWIDGVRHAGAVFLGSHTPEAFGDYCAGPNHVLPTARTARFSSPLGVYDFQKRTSVIGCSPRGARRLAGIASTLARGEDLTAHARSAELRGSGDAGD
ncbi:MAG: histidinol dehydrogenase [Thiotrichales bacterium]|nr:histidinol dehydrogenase [Thiotrichales bacterium]